MAKEQFSRPQSLAIDGKVISIASIATKSVKQFAAHLKQNGIVLDEARLQSVYDACGGGKSDEELEAAAKAAQESK